MFVLTLKFIGGLALLYIGGESLVRGAVSIAKRAGISPLVIGLTVVSFGTSAPELIVSLIAAFANKPDLAVGNVVGSNIFNVLFILGACALLKPLSVSRAIIWRDVPIMIAASLACWLFALDLRISRLEGLMLVVGLVTYTTHAVQASRREGNADQADTTLPSDSLLLGLFFVAVGILGLTLGARWIVHAASAIAQYFGISDAIIGLTIVAAGTSLPEVAASLVATMRNQRDIAVGNVIGSNIFNIFCILGITGTLAPNGVQVDHAIFAFDLPVMLAVALACSPLLGTRHSIERWMGLLFVFYYFAYTAYLILRAQEHDMLEPFSSVMLTFVIPFTLAIIIITYVRGRASIEIPTSKN